MFPGRAVRPRQPRHGGFTPWRIPGAGRDFPTGNVFNLARPSRRLRGLTPELAPSASARGNPDRRPRRRSRPASYQRVRRGGPCGRRGGTARVDLGDRDSLRRCRAHRRCERRVFGPRPRVHRGDASLGSDDDALFLGRVVARTVRALTAGLVYVPSRGTEPPRRTRRFGLRLDGELRRAQPDSSQIHARGQRDGYSFALSVRRGLAAGGATEGSA